jgi:hypothetical protein
MGIEALTVVADGGYFKGEQVLQCDQAGISPLVPKTLTSNSLADGCFDKQDFIYIASDDEYRCPAGQRAIKRFATIERGMTLSKYWSSACHRCPLKAQCTPSDYRRITRWEHVIKRLRGDFESCDLHEVSGRRLSSSFDDLGPITVNARSVVTSLGRVLMFLLVLAVGAKIKTIGRSALRKCGSETIPAGINPLSRTFSRG